MIWDGSSKTRLDPSVYRAPDGADWNRLLKEIQYIQLEIKEGDIYTNISNDFIYIGQPVVLDHNNQLTRARKSNPEVLGISLVEVKPGKNTVYMVNGRLQLEDWIQVTGTSTLISGAYYYLSMTNFGMITSLPPDIGIIVEIGRAQSNKLLSINLKTPLYLEG